MSLEVVRDEHGYISAGINNPGGLNQYSPEIILRRRLALAIGRRMAKRPACVEKFVDAVENALNRPTDLRNLDLLRYAIPAAAVARVELADSVVREQTEIASREQWDSLAVEFSSHFTPTAGLALEESNPEAERGTP